MLLPEIGRQQELGKEVVFRADAAVAKPEIDVALEERGVKCAIRLPANAHGWPNALRDLKLLGQSLTLSKLRSRFLSLR